ncbi:hypothetical protein BX666DRAFT_1989911 [Dichotomocladium elegans]|nr:hypothetical protein BX666DRAFT_1989911 [Dichotomocladium elegans]
MHGPSSPFLKHIRTHHPIPMRIPMLLHNDTCASFYFCVAELHATTMPTHTIVFMDGNMSISSSSAPSTLRSRARHCRLISVEDDRSCPLPAVVTFAFVVTPRTRWTFCPSVRAVPCIVRVSSSPASLPSTHLPSCKFRFVFFCLSLWPWCNLCAVFRRACACSCFLRWQRVMNPWWPRSLSSSTREKMDTCNFYLEPKLLGQHGV